MLATDSRIVLCSRSMTRPKQAGLQTASSHSSRLSGSSSPRVLQEFAVPESCIEVLAVLPRALDEVMPLNQRHRQQLPGDIRRLWEDLTSEKQHRFAEYLGAPAFSSAYCRYFLPWNILRLSSILKNAPLFLTTGSSVLDFGSGPLTFPMALYASRPELRKTPLTIYCADKTQRILAIGKAIFESLCVKIGGELPPWKIELIQLAFGTPLRVQTSTGSSSPGERPVERFEKVDLLAEANMFNEFFWKGEAPLGTKATQNAAKLLSYIKDSGTILLVEPGDPRSGAFISAMRAALVARGIMPIGPCPHQCACPMPGFFRSLGGDEDAKAGKMLAKMTPVVMPKWRPKYPWCHFTLSTESAPPWLEDLSRSAGLPKEKMVLSYLLAAKDSKEDSGQEPIKTDTHAHQLEVRVVSAAFPLPGNKTGCYACSNLGFTLLEWKEGSCPIANSQQNKHISQTSKQEDRLEPSSGDLLALTLSSAPNRRDEKTGAVVIPI